MSLRYRTRAHAPAHVKALLLGLFVVLGVCFAAMPQTSHAITASTNLNFQARLFTASGAVVADGNYNIEFKIYDSVSSGGSAQGVCSLTGVTDHCWWLETRTSGNVVKVVNGYFSVNLGSVTAFGASIPWDQQLYLTMRIGGTGTPSWETTEMLNSGNRMQITSVPLALRANGLAADNGTQTGTLSFSTLANTPVIALPDASGTVCLQTAAACGFAPSTGGTGYVQLDPSSAQADASSNSAIFINKSSTGNLLELQKTSADVFAVGNTGAVTQAGNLTFSQASPVISASASNTGLTLQANGTGTLLLGNTTGAVNGTIQIGVNATSGATNTVQIGTASVATDVVTIGSNNVAGNTVSIDAGTGANSIAIGNSTSAHSISIGSGSGTSVTQTINVGTGTSTTSGGVAVNIATGAPGTGTTNAVHIADDTPSGTGTNAVTIGSISAANNTLLLQGGNVNTAGSEAIRIQTAAAGGIAIGTTGQTGTISLGISTAGQTVQIANGATGAASEVDILSGVGTASTAILKLGDNTRGTQIDLGNIAPAAARTINIGSNGAQTPGVIDTINIGTSNGSVAGAETINIGSGTPTGTNLLTIGSNANVASTTEIRGGNGAGAIFLNPQATTGQILIGAAAGAGQITVGSSSTTQTVAIGNGLGVPTVNIANSSVSGLNVAIGGATNTSGTNTVSILNGASASTSTFNLLSGAGTAGAGDIHIGNNARVNVIDVGNVATAANRTITIGGGNTPTGVSDTVNIATGNTVGTGTKVVHIADGNPAGTNAVTLGSITATANTTLIQGGTSATAIQLQSASGGIISVGNNAVANTIQIGQTSGTAITQTIAIGNGGATSTSNITIGNANIGTTTIQGATAIKVASLTAATANSQALCRDTSTNNLTTCDSGAGGLPFIQNGNSFGATAVLGTNDSNSLTFETNSVTQATIAVGGATTFKNSTDSTAAFQIQDAGGTSLLNVDSATAATLGASFIVDNSIDSAGNELENGGFESGPTGAASRSSNGWNMNGSTSQIVVDNTNAHSGNNEMQITTVTDIAARKLIAVRPGDVIYYEGYVKRSGGGSGTGGFYLTAYDKDFSNAVFSAGDTWTDPSTSYALRTNTYTVPAGKYYVTMAATVRSGATGTWYFDDAYLKRSTENAPIVLQNTANSATAFQVQNAAGSSALTVNTTGLNSIVSNGSFEAGTTGWAASGTGASIVQSTAQEYIGNDSLDFTTGTAVGNSARLTVGTALSTSTTYTLSFYGLAGTPFSALSASYSPDGTAAKETDCAVLAPSNSVITTWTRYTCIIDTSSTAATGSGYIAIKQSDTTSRHLFIDAVQIEAGSAITQAQIANTGFESGATGWAQVGGGTAAQSAADKYNGADSLLITAASAANSGAKYTTANTDPTQLAVSTSYTLSFWAKSSSANWATLAAGYARDGTTGTESSCTLNSISVLTTAWSQYSCIITTDATTPAATAYIIIKHSDAAAHTWYVDDVQLTKQSFIASPVAYQETGIALNGVINSPTAFRNQSNSTTAFQVQNASGTAILSIDSTNAQVIATNAGGNASSDEFNSGSSPASNWTFTTDDSSTATISSGNLIITPNPATSTHNCYTGGSGNYTNCMRLMEPSPTTTGDIQIDTEMMNPNDVVSNEQDILIWQDATNFIRFAYTGTAGSPGLTTHKVIAGSGTPNIFSCIGVNAPVYVRVIRQGSVWTMYYSPDGINYFTCGSLTQSLTVNNIGLMVDKVSAASWTTNLPNFNFFRVSEPTLAVTGTLQVTAGVDNSNLLQANDNTGASILSLKQFDSNWSLNLAGSATFQNVTNTTNAFRVQNSGGGNVLAVDTTNTAIVVGTGEGGTPALATIRGAVAGGSNIQGGNINLDASNGTGSAGSGSLVFRTAPSNTASATIDGRSSSITPTAGASSLTIPHTVTASSNTLLVVSITTNSGTVSSVTYNAVSMTSLTSGTVAGTTHYYTYYLNTSGTTGAHNIVINTSASTRTAAGAVSFANVNTSSPLGTAVVTSASSGTTRTSGSITSDTHDIIFDGLSSNAIYTPVDGSGQTQVSNQNDGTTSYLGAVSTKPGIASTTASWTAVSNTANTTMVDVSVHGNPGTATSSDTLATRLLIDQNGNVGIGTSSPTATLNVVGSDIFQAATNSINTFQIQNSGGISLLTADTLNNSIILTGTSTTYAFPTTSVIDPFTRANSGTLGANWTLYPTQSDLQIISNTAAGTAGGGNFDYWNASQFGPNVEAYTQITTLAGSGNDVLVAVRVSNPGASGNDYRAIYTQGTGLLLYKYVAGTFTQLGSTLSLTLAANDQIGISAIGSTITLWYKQATGTNVWTNGIQASDSSLSGSGYIALEMDGTTGRVDNFGGGTGTSTSTGSPILQVQDSASTSLFQVNSFDGQVYIHLNGSQPSGGGQRLCSSLADATAGLTAIQDCGSGGSDYAEDYGTTDPTIAAGDVVALDPSKPAEDYTSKGGQSSSKSWVVKASSINQNNLLGVVSTAPNETIGQVFSPNENPRPVAQVGRVPVKVNGQNGAIQPGDYLVPSDIPGQAMKATSAGWSIGVALSGYNGTGPGTVYVFANRAWYAAPVSLQNAQSVDSLIVNGQLAAGGTETGTLQVDTNAQVSGNIAATGNLQVEGQANFSQNLSVSGNLTAGGSALFQSSTNSTAAFQIQSASGVAILSVDSTNGNVIIGAGATGDTTGELIVLDSDTNATYRGGTASNTPAEIDGSMFYSSSDHAFLCGVGGSWQTCSGILGSNTVASNPVNTCTNACPSFDNGRFVIPANYLQPGKVIHLVAQGVYSITGTPTFGAWGVYFGSNATAQTSDTLLGGATTASNNLPTGASNQHWKVDFTITCYTAGSSGTISAAGTFTFVQATLPASETVLPFSSSTTTTVNTTTSQTIYLFPEWSASSASNTVTAQQFYLKTE